jgi:polysaccharide deacetylase 2 family uncharacterized protein YibQ
VFHSFSFAYDKPKLSLIIDDLGYSLNYGKKAYDLVGDHTYAIIPNSVYAKKLSVIGQQKHKELIMHLPMQSSSHKVQHERDTLNATMTESKLIATTQRFLNEMPHISGINNHMGSHLTQYDYFMRPVMETIFKHNPKLYFLDSRTSANSTAYRVALKAGLNASQRNVFLDHSNVPSDIRFQFKSWLKKATQGHSAVAIAHPSKSTLSVIRPLLYSEKNNFEFIPLSRYLSIQKESKPWPRTYLSLLHKGAKNLKQSR